MAEKGLISKMGIFKKKDVLIGVDDILKDLIYHIEAGNIVVLEGKSGSGKSRILKEIMSRLGHKYKMIYVNEKNFENLRIDKIVRKSLGIIGQIFRLLPRNAILLLDGIENISKKNCEKIKYYYDKDCLKSIIFATEDFEKLNLTESLRHRIRKKFVLEKLNEDDAIKLVKIKIGEILPENILKRILSFSKTNGEFLKICKNIYKEYNTTGTINLEGLSMNIKK